MIGSIADPADRIELARIAAERTTLVDYRPVSEVPRLTLIGDLVCLLQDSTHMTTEHQLPAKLTEVLAMGVPVLARETPPLKPLVSEGLISGIGDARVSARISQLFADPDGMRAQAQRGRRFFTEQLSYGATLEVLQRVFDGLDDSRHELPATWGRALGLARNVAHLSGSDEAAIPPAPPAADQHSSAATERECPFCGLVCASFEPLGEDEHDARCPRCGSLERDRLMWLYLLNETDLFSGPERRALLHVDPEVPSWQRLARVPTVASVNSDGRRDLARLDLTELPFPDESFDVVCCGRAFERAVDRECAAHELARMLRPGGWALVCANGAAELARAGLQVTVDPYPGRIREACAERFGLPPGAELLLARTSPGGGSVRRPWPAARDLSRHRPFPERRRSSAVGSRRCVTESCRAGCGGLQPPNTGCGSG